MAQVVEIVDRFVLPSDENSVVVWLGPIGHPEYGTFESFKSRISTPNAFAADADWISAIENAIALADRSGIPTVYVVRH